ncbi:hypothetical protein SAMN05444349_1082 [Bacteroides faecichinchillae]|uniref:Uncharacterized protein n=1 Tax=Bacteroides faecichinchillae TaxID=871325 RepID=A0A1M4X9S9_9BACE|nr:hypothetical protein SAMN05444349_1082 [Bacteroides faecichinchillae]
MLYVVRYFLGNGYEFDAKIDKIVNSKQIKNIFFSFFLEYIAKKYLDTNKNYCVKESSIT